MTADTSLAAYLIRVSLALALLIAFAAFIKFKFNKTRGMLGSSGAEILASLSLGKDAFFVVRCGPDVIAFITGSSGILLAGKWKYDDWIKFKINNEQDAKK